MSTIRNIFSFECPCCKQRINALKIMRVENGCKSLRDKKCFYCPTCDNRIGRAHSAKLSIALQVGLVLFVYYLINTLGSYFDCSIYIYPFAYVILFYLLLVAFINIYSFTCYKEIELEIEREGFDKFYSPHGNVRMDDFEKNTIRTITFIPIVFIVIAFIVLISIVIG